MRALTLTLASLGLATLAAAPLAAQELREGFGGADPGSPAPASEVADAPSQGFAILGGVMLEFTSDQYIDDDGEGTGASLEPEAYLEAELNGFYAGVWATTADQDYGTDEIDLYLGYRRELDSGFSYDAGYTRYYYPDDGWDCCGELTLSLFAPAGEKFGLGTDLAWDPENEIGNAYLYAEFYATDQITVSANYGFYQTVDLPDETEWDFGATYNFTDETALDLRWYEGSDYAGYIALALSFDTTIFQR